jgi:hypothetical protein
VIDNTGKQMSATGLFASLKYRYATSGTFSIRDLARSAYRTFAVGILRGPPDEFWDGVDFRTA